MQNPGFSAHIKYCIYIDLYGYTDRLAGIRTAGRQVGRYIYIFFLYNLKKTISHWTKRCMFEKYKSDVHHCSSDEHQFSSRENVPVFATIF